MRKIIVVVSILALLGGTALLVVVGRPIVTTYGDQIRSDVSGLHEAVLAFRTHFNCKELPSRIRLSSKLAEMDQESLTFLREMFPNPEFMANWQKFGMAWNNLAIGPITLEGDQCLVFFLGGPQAGGRPIGWSTDPTNPTAIKAGTRFSFYDFPLESLQTRSGQTYLSFYDAYRQQPYAYFSDSPRRVSHCQSLGLLPYRLRNEEAFQIISAGRNGRFGAKGDVWSPDNAALTYPPDSDGADDLANFHGRKPLGK